jgi:hypothetical protein
MISSRTWLASANTGARYGVGARAPAIAPAATCVNRHMELKPPLERSIGFLRPVDEHDRNIVRYGVAKTAVPAYEVRTRFIEDDRILALGTGKDVEELFLYHGIEHPLNKNP